ncbi:hypothetical protein DEU56DRAFT_807089 [Suillus clintonianus]|uniref:uncharacterized protein n=1 Tax=Suillus clintonianus TaxID=1904413 RepID=UPI001B875FA5|nr:uncharacterized protein DEU56DRAFT_807089 [Suillus clintonianus]KAG2135451.1 hypothetical protein DEU56DRAFT_807089 [Suillus clintonianus]
MSTFDARVVIGPVQVCGLLSAALFGSLACQTYLYFARFANDHIALKATVSAVILIQLGHFVCVISTLWTMTVSTYGDPYQLSVLPLALDLAVPLSGLTVFVVQSFYAFRLWRLTKNVFLPIFCQMLSVLAQISTFVVTAKAISMTNVVTFGEQQLGLIEVSFIARAACDLITTVGIAWGLKKQRVSDIRGTSTMIDRLIKWTIETGLITSVMAFTLATWFLVLKQQNFMWIGVWLLWPDVVGNTLLASLNRRWLLRDNAPRTGTQSYDMNTIVFSTRAAQPQADPLESFKDRDIQAFQEAEHAINPGQKPIHIRAIV